MIALKTIASNFRQAAFITSSYDILIKKIPYFGNIAFERNLNFVNLFQLRTFLSIA